MSSLYNRILSLREKVEEKRNAIKLCAPAGPLMLDVLWDAEDKSQTIWYEDNACNLQGIQLFNKQNTLSGEILRLKKNPPIEMGGFLRLDGDSITKLSSPPSMRDIPAPDDEDLFDLVSALPVVEFNGQLHFRKRGKYRSEILNLLRCQGGSCPGTPISNRLIQLLGADTEGHLFFPKLTQWQFLEFHLRSIGAYKDCVLQLISGFEALHSLDIIHRDLRPDNVLFDEKEKRLVICDLESRWGNRLAPEIEGSSGLEDIWTMKTNIFDLGTCLQSLIYMNNPIMQTLERPVPAPFDEVFEACMQPDPELRPTLEEVRLMVERIEGEGS